MGTGQRMRKAYAEKLQAGSLGPSAGLFYSPALISLEQALLGALLDTCGPSGNGSRAAVGTCCFVSLS